MCRTFALELITNRMGSVPYSIMNILNKKRTVQNAPAETCAELYERLNEGYELSLRNFQERFNSKNEQRFSMRRVATAKEVAIMEAMYPPKKEKVSVSKAGIVPEAKVSPVIPQRKSKPTDWHNVAVRAMFGAGVIGHAVLIWWECRYLWGSGGAIASGIVGVVICSSVLEIAKKPSGETAQNLLYLVWLLDLCAWFVHKKALYHSGSNAFGAGIDEYGTGCLAIVICICAGAMMYFYRETGLKK